MEQKQEVTDGRTDLLDGVGHLGVLAQAAGERLPRLLQHRLWPCRVKRWAVGQSVGRSIGRPVTTTQTRVSIDGDPSSCPAPPKHKQDRHVLTSGAMSTLVTTTASGIWSAQAMEMCSLVMTCTPMFPPTRSKAKSGSMPGRCACAC